MNALRRHPRALCWTMVVVLLSSLWLAGLTPQRASTAIVDQVLGALVVCGAHDGAEPDGPIAPSPPHCLACALLKGLAWAVLVLVGCLFGFGPRPTGRSVPRYTERRPTPFERSRIRPRAPPLFA